MIELKIISLYLNDNRKMAGRWLRDLAKSHVWPGTAANQRVLIPGTDESNKIVIKDMESNICRQRDFCQETGLLHLQYVRFLTPCES